MRYLVEYFKLVYTVQSSGILHILPFIYGRPLVAKAVDFQIQTNCQKRRILPKIQLVSLK